MRRFWIALALAGALLLPGIKAVSAGQERPSPTITHVVEPGETLWKIAGDLRPSEDRRRVVYELMQLNALRTAALTPGQRIELPLR